VNDIASLKSDLENGNRRALARAITLVESTRADHRDQTLALMEALSGNTKQALRIGLTGTPGVGKSTFTESFGMMLIGLGLRVAVLAVDPSSTRTGGSILGDKTRMDLLSRERSAFIRPSPGQAREGGVARRSREAIRLCEAAGYDIVIVETIGVGQSETMVADMTDIFLLLLAPAGGDELQGVKRGIMEIADLIVVNKADGVLKTTAQRTCADYAGALRLMRKRPTDPAGFPKAMTVSAQEGEGLDTTWAAIGELAKWRRDTGIWSDTRQKQALAWFKSELQMGLVAGLNRDPALATLRDEMAEQVKSGAMTPDGAAARVLAELSAR
jgi:LAO/AO transport system kinase